MDLRTSSFLIITLGLAPTATGAQEQKTAALSPIPTEFAAAARQTMEDCTVHTLVGPTETPLPLDLSNFLLDHPDFSAFLIHRRKIAPYKIAMRGPKQSWADDGAGTRGLVNLVLRTRTRRVYFGEGEHNSLFFPTVFASAVVIMDLREENGSAKRLSTVSSFEVYVRMRNRFVSNLVKILRPFLRTAVVGKFSKAFFVANALGRSLANDPSAVAHDLDAFAKLPDDERSALLGMIARLTPLPQTAPPAPSRR